MISSYLKVALRTLKRYRGHTAINLVGLTAGLTCCLLVFLYVEHETSYDEQFADADRIFRVIRSTSGPTAAPLGPAMAAELPEVETPVRITPEELVVRTEEADRFTQQVYLTDSTFFDVFDYASAGGSLETALDRPDNVVLTIEAARRYFGDADPIGRTFRLGAEQQLPVTVAAVVAPPAGPTHFDFDVVAPLELLAREGSANRFENWTTNWIYTYFLARPGTRAADVQERLPALFERHVGEAYSEYRVQPLTDVHLHSAGLEWDIEPQGSITAVRTFSAIALLVLLIAGINFVNLTTARSARRAREVGLRRMLGAGRLQLAGQFVGEAVLLSLLGLLAAFAAAAALLPTFNDLLQQELALSVLGRPSYLLGALGFAMLTGGLAGAYPAFYLSGLSPSGAFRSEEGPRGRSSWIRQGLVVLQFGLAAGLIVGTFVVQGQTGLLRTTSPGFEEEHVLVIPSEELAPRGETVRTALSGHPEILNVEATSAVPGQPLSDYRYRPEGVEAEGDELPIWDTYFVGPAFADLLEIPVRAGRSFSRQRTADENAFVLNRAAVEDARERAGASWDDPIGRRLRFYLPDATGWSVAKEGPVVGVIENIRYRSLREESGPLVLQLVPDQFAPQVLDHFLVRITGDRIPETIAFLESRTRELGAHGPMEYYFLNDHMDTLYAREARTGRMFTYFSFLALLIAGLGMIGLAAFVAERRTKEMSVRKVLGATAAQVVGLLSWDFLKPVLLALVLAFPIAYWAMSRWLRDFSVQIELGPEIFLGAALITTTAAVLTVSAQAIRTARTNPAESLRYE